MLSERVATLEADNRHMQTAILGLTGSIDDLTAAISSLKEDFSSKKNFFKGAAWAVGGIVGFISGGLILAFDYFFSK